MKKQNGQNGVPKCLGKPFCSFLTILNGLENGLKNGLENGLTLQILRWYKWLRFKDIVWGFGKLKKWLKNGMIWRIEKSEKIKWNGMGRMGKKIE